MSRRTKSVLGLLLLLGVGRSAMAIDVPIEGNRLWLADLRATRRAHVVSRSAAIDLTGVDPTASRDCNASNPSTCQLRAECTAANNCLDGWESGVGRVYAARTDCAPPSDPCMELVMDGTAAGCCTDRAKDCAGEFGNNPAFSYGCDAGVCTATPK